MSSTRPDAGTIFLPILYCGPCSLPKLVYKSPSLIGPQLWGVKVRRPYPPPSLAMFPDCLWCLAYLLRTDIVLVFVLSVSWSVICYQEVVEGSRPDVHCQKRISVTILTSTAWRTPGSLVPYLPLGGHHSLGATFLGI